MKNKLFIAIALIVVAFNFSSCKKNDNTNTNSGGGSSNGAPTLTSNYYFQANIDGTWVTFQSNNSSLFAGFGSSSSMIGDTIKGYKESSSIEDINELNGGGIGCIGTNKLYNLDSIDLFNLFTLGSKQYGLYEGGSVTNFTNGGLVYYIVNGVTWASDKGVATQTGSTFTITEFSDNNTDFYSEKIVAGTFSCKLYDGNGGTKTLTNGKYRGRVIDIFP